MTNGLNELDGEYYYAQTNGELVVGKTGWVSQKNGLIPDKGDWYAFDEKREEHHGQVWKADP